MLDLSLVKLLIVFIVAVILLGPDKLPQVARQLGAGWRRLQEFRDRVDREVRENIPDLPSSQEIARFARSPVALLNQLADFGVDQPLVEDPGAPGGAGAGGGAAVAGAGGAGAGGAGAANGTAGAAGTTDWPQDPGLPPVPVLPDAPDDPGMN